MERQQEIMQKLAVIEQLLQGNNLLKKEALTLEEACQYLDVSPSYIYKLTSTHQIPHYCPTGKKLYFKRSELDEWLLSNRHATRAEMDSKASNYINRRAMY